MQIKIHKIAVLPFAWMLCFFHAMVGMILGIVVFISTLTSGEEQGWGSLGPWSIIVFPLLNGAFGFLAGMCIAVGYNLFSKKFNGVLLEIEES